MITPRLATIDDIGQIRRHEHEFSHVTDDLLKQVIQNNWVYVVEVEDEIVGYARLEFIWLNVPYLALITLEEEHRGKGIGTAMIERISQDLVTQGKTSLYTSSEVMEPKPQMFHRKCGFRECGIIAGMNDGIGEIFFVKKLAESA
ncbi:MAG: GNAT family N-acetyltransferase [Candidatus Thorarchaeota archaeon]|nr:GNAT family N-acetyltransferase [Candidatus Thorarchaeota archaeon]